MVAPLRQMTMSALGMPVSPTPRPTHASWDRVTVNSIVVLSLEILNVAESLLSNVNAVVVVAASVVVVVAASVVVVAASVVVVVAASVVVAADVVVAASVVVVEVLAPMSNCFEPRA